MCCVAEKNLDCNTENSVAFCFQSSYCIRVEGNKDTVMQDRTNQVVRGVYQGQPYRGAVRSSRVKLAGAIEHVVDLFDDISVFGDSRSTILIEETDDFSVDCEDVYVYLV
jgi:hypothetical protein